MTKTKDSNNIIQEGMERLYGKSTPQNIEEGIDWHNHVEEIDAIIELVEDRTYPARRSILDYIEKIFGFPKDLSDYVNKKLESLDNKIKYKI